MEDRSLLRLINIQIREREKHSTLLDCPELTLHTNEILGVCGRSGVGKSLLLKTIALLTPLDPKLVISGKIQFEEEGNVISLLEMNPKWMRAFRAAHFGMITQEPQSSFNPSRKIGQHLTDILAASNRTSTGAPIHYLELVDLGNEPQILKRYPAELSGGQLQRVSVACAFAQDADIILCDEPTSSLDVKQRDRFYQLLRRLQIEFGKAIIVVSHDLVALDKYCDRVVTLTNSDQKIAPETPRNIHPEIPLTTEDKQKAQAYEHPDFPIMSVEHLSYSYQSQSGSLLKVLQEIHLEIKQPGIFAIIGASGCGKTTLARIIAGDYVGYHGDLKFQGISYRDFAKRDLNGLKRSIQYVFQDALEVLNPSFKVGELLLQANRDAIRHSNDLNKRSLETICHDYRIPFHLMDRYPHQLSGGERQRINLARALLYKPIVLILDEPLSGIDYQDKSTFYNWLRKVFFVQKNTVIWITHDLNEVAQIADHLYVMDEGRIVEEGAPEIIFKNPTHQATISLLKASIQA